MNVPKQKIISAVQAYNTPMATPVVIGPKHYGITMLELLP